MTSRTGSARRILGDFEKVSGVESCLGRRRSTFACSRRPWAGVARDGVGRWKSQNRKMVPLSPYVEKPLNSKVIKSFVPELRSRKCFRVSRFLCSIYVYMLWTSHVHFAYPYHEYGTKGFQVSLSNAKNFWNRCIWKYSTTTLGQDGPRSNSNKNYLYTLQNSRSEISPPNNTVCCIPRTHPFYGGMYIPSLAIKVAAAVHWLTLLSAC